MIRKENLVGYWKLNGNTEDYSKHGNNGTWHGNETYAKNKFGKLTGEFDGSGDCISTGFNGVDLPAWTFTFWGKTNDLPATSNNYALDNSPSGDGFIIKQTSGVSRLDTYFYTSTGV